MINIVRNGWLLRKKRVLETPEIENEVNEPKENQIRQRQSEFERKEENLKGNRKRKLKRGLEKKT